MKEILINPMWKTTIHKAIFVNEEIIVYPDKDMKLPNCLTSAVKFLFGEGAYIVEDFSDGLPKYIIKCASHVLSNVSTLNASWSTQEVKEGYDSKKL